MLMGGSDMVLHTTLKQQHCQFNLTGEASLDFTEFFGGIDYWGKNNNRREHLMVWLLAVGMESSAPTTQLICIISVLSGP